MSRSAPPGTDMSDVQPADVQAIVPEQTTHQTPADAGAVIQPPQRIATEPATI